MNSPTTSERKDPTFSDEDPTLTTTEDEDKQLIEDRNPLQPLNPQSPKTTTLEIPDADEPPLHGGDPNQGDQEEITPLSPTFTYSRRRFDGGGAGKRKKRNFAQEKKSQKKLETLAGKLKLVPFKPVKTLDLSSHEPLLRRLGLWDFAHLDFDFKVHHDLILQLIASFSPSVRCSKVNEFRIKVTRADLARALRLPVKKEKVENAMEVKESDESVSFIEEFVLTFLLLHGEDTWMMPDDIHSTMKLIKDGNFEKVDFAKLIWQMVEKELANSELANCYYASHLQLLIKSQREDILKVQQEPVRMEIDLKEDDEEEGEGGEEVPKTGEEHELARGSELEEHNIELSLGGPDNTVNDDGMKETKEQSDNVYDYATDFEESKEVDEQGQWVNNTMDGHFLQRCNFGEVGSTECEEERKQHEEGDGDGEGYEEEEEEEGKEGEYEEENEEGEEMPFSISPNDVAMECENSENLIAAIEASQNPFSSGLQNRDNVSSSVDYFTSRVDTVQTMPCGSSLFNNGNNGSKRVIEHLDNDIPNHTLNSGNKRMRSDGHWDNCNPQSSFDIYMEQIQHVTGKARMLYNAKEQAYQALSVQHQLLISDFEQQRTNMYHSLQKSKMEEQHKRQAETYRLERELCMMGNLLDGYRKALKETARAFAEYRKKCPLPEEPIYKDTGSGGLVLSSTELENLRLKQEKEERQNLLLGVKKIEEFVGHCIPKFEVWESLVESLGNKLQNVEKEVNFCKEGIAAKRKKAGEMSECAPFEEQVTRQFEIAECAPSEEQVTQLVEMSECAPSEEQGTQQAEMSECAPTEEQVTQQFEIAECVPSEEQVPEQVEMSECDPSEEQVTEQVEMSECDPSEKQGTQLSA